MIRLLSIWKTPPGRGFFRIENDENVWQFLWECWSTSIETDHLRFLVEACSGF